MKDALKNLSKEQIDFICNECTITKEKLFAMDEDNLYDNVYEKMCDIEIDEVCENGGGDETERCSIASDIVTILGNALAESEGYFDSENE